MSKYFLVSENDKEVAKCLCMSEHLQDILDYIKEIRYRPYYNLRIYSSHEAPLAVHYVDGKLMID